MTVAYGGEQITKTRQYIVRNRIAFAQRMSQVDGAHVCIRRKQSCIIASQLAMRTRIFRQVYS